ncbi:LLM class flavin-dependent oxidoreductase [Pseudonocardia sp. TRM90224]|uniref:LLM class flavin-dependent oxidoreductase n=1 Tax=Pseudonocardia sp. TRM90224 TaxID=2812678 RepID=UPI001E44C210|nr:LLM class flavin-dependent oxidoreductase [Pseudonocardia sp. TRM90224]
MNRTSIGLGLQGDKPPGRYAELAGIAESFDFDVLSVFGDLTFQPPIVPLLEMAKATTRVRLGAACWNPFTMHPYEIAGQVAALDLVSSGRAYLGLAQGAWLDTIGVERRRPVRAVEEAVAVIGMLLAGDRGGFDGEVFRLAPGTCLSYPTRRAKVPVLIGAWGPRMVALAGRVADEVKVGGTANPEMVAVIRERAGTDALGIVAGAVTVVDEDAGAARARARHEVAMYLGVVAALDPTVDVPAELLPEIERCARDGEHHRLAELIPDAMLDRFAFAGTPEHVAEQAQRLIDAGVSRVEFGTPHGLSDDHGITLLGSEVLPRLRRHVW